MKLIDLYKEWMETGCISDRVDPNGMGGLCNAVPKKYLKLLKKFEPEECQIYWASSRGMSSDGAIYKFNKLRQTIVLLICAMCNEL